MASHGCPPYRTEHENHRIRQHGGRATHVKEATAVFGSQSAIAWAPASSMELLRKLRQETITSSPKSTSFCALGLSIDSLRYILSIVSLGLEQSEGTNISGSCLPSVFAHCTTLPKTATPDCTVACWTGSRRRLTNGHTDTIRAVLFEAKHQPIVAVVS